MVYKSVRSDSKSESAIKMVQGWVQNCNHHKDCVKKALKFLPTRLIDVGDPSGTQEPCLFVPGETNPKYVLSGEHTNYIALSYCWGSKEELVKNPCIKTTSSTLSDYIKSIPLAILPKTIADAINFTRQLGVRYLWVDSLCILQGNDQAAQEDWRRKSSKMASVYGGAFLTLAAARSYSVHDGIFEKREEEISNGLALKINSNHDKSTRGSISLHKSFPYFKDLLGQLLYRRAWTL